MKTGMMRIQQWLVSTLTALPLVLAHAAPAPVQDLTAASSYKHSGDTANVSHLVNTINELRQEVMTMQGLLEEQAFAIEQLKQESRDRYLELDERITRMPRTQASVPVAATVVSQQVSTDLPSKNTAQGSVPSSQTTLDGKEEASYHAAFELIRAKKFAAAKAALTEQIETYPKGRFTSNAYYWLGEVEIINAAYPQARDAFLKVIKDYPKSNKIADAQYKLGRVYDLLGEKTKAKQAFEAVIKNHAGSGAAKLADTYLRTVLSSH